ncbi:hypothetical protein Q8A67_014014 [Cirrhinus molitorella]|uniref:Fibrinogen C-terminal domain-containing protein n=1 Tax=Cirrhinus molitorella TaxID=172907 RepID=A0AA88TM99_9TELE|nr:hypothetical protein Q8A67_014014 [Cirrhinus molitorella]
MGRAAKVLPSVQVNGKNVHKPRYSLCPAGASIHSSEDGFPAVRSQQDDDVISSRPPPCSAGRQPAAHSSHSQDVTSSSRRSSENLPPPSAMPHSQPSPNPLSYPWPAAPPSTNGKNGSGVYTITTLDGPLQVYCEMVSGGQKDKGHWMVILRRMNGEVNFFRPWENYKQSFGNKEGEYWLGAEHIHQLTRRYQYKLRVDLEDFEGKKVYAVYESFSVDSEADGYKLHVSGFVDGGADHDGSMNIGASWYHWKTNYNSLKTITMKIRRVM